jgi:hypothetical protein
MTFSAILLLFRFQIWLENIEKKSQVYETLNHDNFSMTMYNSGNLRHDVDYVPSS